MRWWRVIVLFGTVIVVAAAAGVVQAAKRAGSAPARPLVRLVLERQTMSAGEVLQVALVSETPYPILLTNCLVLQLRESRTWKTINSTNDGIACSRRDTTSVGARARLEETLVLPHELQPGRYRIALRYEWLPQHWRTASRHGYLHAVQTATAVLTVGPGAEPQLPEWRIKQIALSAAAMNGDPHPSLVQHAEGTRDLAGWVASGAFVDDATWSYLIAIRGHFTGRCAPTRRVCSTSPENSHGYLNNRRLLVPSVIVLVISAKTRQLEDFGAGDVYPDLAGLGPVTTDYRH
jgi:hypothetical protein